MNNSRRYQGHSPASSIDPESEGDGEGVDADASAHATQTAYDALCVLEENAFIPVDPTITLFDEGKFKEYQLRECAIYPDERDGDYGNILEAYAGKAFVVYGDIVIDDRKSEAALQKQFLKGSTRKIKIKSSYFSIGSSDDATSADLWIRGDRRWFEIEPSKEFVTTFQHMVDAIKCYHCLLFIHENVNHASYPVAAVLEDYATFDGASLDQTSIIHRIKSHASFLIGHMLQYVSDVNWPRTPFFKWLAYECFSEYRILVAKQGRQAVVPPKQLLDAPQALQWSTFVAKPEPVQKLLQPPPRASARHQSLPLRRERGPSRETNPSDNASTKTAVRILNATRESPDFTAPEIILDLIIEGAKQIQKNNYGWKRIADWLNRTYSLRSEYYGANSHAVSDHMFCLEITKYHASSVVAILNASWKTKQVGVELVQVAKEFADEVAANSTLPAKAQQVKQRVWDEITSVVFKLRKTVGVRKAPEKKSIAQSESERSAPARGVGKKPRLSIPGGYQLKRGSSVLEDDDDDDDYAETMIAAPRAMAVPSIPTATSSKKRRQQSPTEMGSVSPEPGFVAPPTQMVFRPAATALPEEQVDAALELAQHEGRQNNLSTEKLAEYLKSRSGAGGFDVQRIKRSGNGADI